MARPRKNATGQPTKLSGGQAAYVLERLLKDRRVSQSDVNGYLSQMSAEISDLEARLQHLKDAVGGAASAAAASIASVAASAVAAVRRKPGRPPGSGKKSGRPPGRPPGRPGRPPGRPPASASAAAPASGGGASEGAASKGGKRGRKRAAITSEQLASRQLQGRYLALVRRFPANRRAAIAKTAKEKGREAAIKEMQDSLGKR
ncbi:MAG TPA: hypothetical protein VFV49_15185 [Thermoanaerobaculia bacterium]|nr:hypothetical protein [Thermoanaerobaculia bacterium]